MGITDMLWYPKIGISIDINKDASGPRDRVYLRTFRLIY